MTHDVEPLETGVWLAQLENLAANASHDEARLVACLRRGFHLALLAPRPLRHLIGCTASEPEFENLLEHRAMLPAALSLLGTSMNYTLSHLDSAGRIEAEVWFSNECHGGGAVAPTAPLAIFRAWLDCLTALERTTPKTDPVDPSLPALHRSQSGRRPTLTEH